MFGKSVIFMVGPRRIFNFWVAAPSHKAICCVTLFNVGRIYPV